MWRKKKPAKGRVVRVVTLCAHTPKRKGSRERLWAFSAHDLASLLGRKPDGVKKSIQRQTLGFDPEDLEAVCLAWFRKNEHVVVPAFIGPRREGATEGGRDGKARGPRGPKG